MATVRLVYPDYIGGGLTTYWLGAKLMEHLVPANPNQQTLRVEIAEPDGTLPEVVDGISGKETVVDNIREAQELLEKAHPDRVITIGGTCLVSLASFDYLHGLYPEAGIVWIDAHPDVSKPENGYPNAHAMVLGSLLGDGTSVLKNKMKHPPFAGKDVLYVGLQGLHDYQAQALQKLGVNATVQTQNFVSMDEIKAFVSRYPQILVHFDIDVLDPALFHSTYFANKNLVGDGSGGGRMTIEQLSGIFEVLGRTSDIVGLTVAEYLPFDEERLHNAFKQLPIFAV